jgi:hypothetical protein
LVDLARDRDVRVEWASNERVALETAVGVSIAGRRALVCTKSVGMSIMLDPLMVLNRTSVHGGLVIVPGDDPGGYGSQNDQDTRPLATLPRCTDRRLNRARGRAVNSRVGRTHRPWHPAGSGVRGSRRHIPRHFGGAASAPATPALGRVLTAPTASQIEEAPRRASSGPVGEHGDAADGHSDPKERRVDLSPDEVHHS